MRSSRILWLLLGLLLAAGLLEAQPRRPGRSGTRAGHRTRPAGAHPGMPPETVAFIRENFPERAARLEILREQDPTTFREKARELHREVERLMELKEKNKALFDVHMEEIRLRTTLRKQAKTLREAGSETERQQARTALRASLERAFDLRQQIKQGEVEELRDRLKELESGLERRKGRRAELIEEQLRKLASEEPESDW
jgi:hypothetical protein